MEHPEADIHKLRHEAMQNVAPIPVELGKKPDEMTYFDLNDTENVQQLMVMDNVARNLGQKVIDMKNTIDVDALTGAGSKQNGIDRMQEIVDSGQDLEIFYLDFNNFSKVNNTLGHDTGDTTLIRLVSSLIGSLREGETIHRFGGDEFVIVKNSSIKSDRRGQDTLVDEDRREDKDRREVSPNKEVDGLKDRFSTAYKEGIVTLEEILGKDLSSIMGLSIGHAKYQNGQSLEDLLKEADQKMYLDKQSQKKIKMLGRVVGFVQRHMPHSSKNVA